MIIDIHTHYGIIENKFNMPIQKQLSGMTQAGINYALISNIECGESMKSGKDEISGNIKMIKIAREFFQKFGVMLWCAPNSEKSDITAFENLYKGERDIIKGLKIHPDISGLEFSDEKFYPYFIMAEKYSLPVLIHTKESPYSKVSFVVEVAEKFPNVNFILGHMSLGGNKSESFAAIKNYKNIYGDTAWVAYDDCIKAEKYGITDKIMFGTDSPITEKCTYLDKYYEPDYYNVKDEVHRKIMCDNAKKLFGL